MPLNLLGATPRQQDYINDLLAKRDFTLPEGYEVASPAAASVLISQLLAAPKKPVAPKAAPANPERNELFEALSVVPKSKYAIPTSELFLDAMDERVKGDLLFVEVKEYNKVRYIRRLHGSVGAFTRTRLSRKDSLVVLGLIRADAYKYTRLFGEHYACCGRCGAELSDQRSRELQLGPECRKYFGF